MRGRLIARLPAFLLLSPLALAGVASAAAAQGGLLTGVVREDSSKRPLAGAEVAIDSLRRQVITDEDGRYTLTALPTGSFVLSVRRLGYRKVGTSVQVFAGQTDERDFDLPRAPAVLPGVKIVEMSSSMKYALALVDEHRKRGFGKFIDSTELKKREEEHISDVLRQFSNISLGTPPLCAPLGTRKYNCTVSPGKKVAMSGGQCAMQIVMDEITLADGGTIDGAEYSRDMRHNWDATYDLTTLTLSNVLAIEVYKRGMDVPMEYQRDDTECGLVKIWTKR